MKSIHHSHSGDTDSENHFFGHNVLKNQIEALLRTFRHRFKDFQKPCLFSRTFQVLKIWKKIQGLSKTCKDPQEPRDWLTAGKYSIHRQIGESKNLIMSNKKARMMQISHNYDCSQFVYIVCRLEIAQH